MPRNEHEKQQKTAATALAMVGVGLSAFAILGLAALVIPDIFKILLVLAALLAFGFVQYALWGWKLDRDRIQDDDDL